MIRETKLAELTADELVQVTGGRDTVLRPKKKKWPPVADPDDGDDV